MYTNASVETAEIIKLGKNDKRSIAIPIRGLPGNNVRSSIIPNKLAAAHVSADTEGGRLRRLTSNAIVARLNDETKKNIHTKIANKRDAIFREIVMTVVV